LECIVCAVLAPDSLQELCKSVNSTVAAKTTRAEPIFTTLFSILQSSFALWKMEGI